MLRGSRALTSSRLSPISILQARVLSTESYWMDHGSEISPLDLAVGWGPMSDQAVLDEISMSQGQRWYRFWPRHQKMPITGDDITQHSANIHTIPATPEIKKQLRALREGDIVELDGSLVEVQWPDGAQVDQFAEPHRYRQWRLRADVGAQRRRPLNRVRRSRWPAPKFPPSWSIHAHRGDGAGGSAHRERQHQRELAAELGRGGARVPLLGDARERDREIGRLQIVARWPA